MNFIDVEPSGKDCLAVEFGEQAMSVSPQDLIKREIQKGTCIYWRKSDADLPLKHMGVVLK